jgi:hypothetical protein
MEKTLIIRKDITLEKWQKTHRIFPFTVVCNGCQHRLLADTPFQDGIRVGLVSETCPCGNSIMARKVKAWAKQKQENLLNKNGELLPLAI